MDLSSLRVTLSGDFIFLVGFGQVFYIFLKIIFPFSLKFNRNLGSL